MPEKNNPAVLTLSLMAMFTVLCRTGIHASNQNDYAKLPSMFRNKDDKTENLLQLLLFPIQSVPFQQDQSGEINPFLPSDYVNEGTFYPLIDYEEYSIEAPGTDDQILSVNELKADRINEYVKPSYTKLLKIIDQLKVPQFRSISTNKEKRDWSSNSAFGTLVDAAGRLGRLDGGDSSKTESRRFHSWGG